MHGKDIADGDGSAVSGMVRSSFQDDYGKGTQNLVRHLALQISNAKSGEEKQILWRKRPLRNNKIYLHVFG